MWQDSGNFVKKNTTHSCPDQHIEKDAQQPTATQNHSGQPPKQVLVAVKSSISIRDAAAGATLPGAEVGAGNKGQMSHILPPL